MKKKPIRLTIERSRDAWWAWAQVEGGLISSSASSLEESKGQALEAVNLFYEDKGMVYAASELSFTWDVQLFFEFYGLINAKALAHRIGMSQRLLAQYANGIKKPSPKQVQRIMDGIRSLGKELSELELI